MHTILLFLQKPIFRDRKLIIAIWFIIPLIASIKHIIRGVNNNYYIFKYSYYHLVNQTNLYTEYPNEYFDTNHYGPFFSLIIAPFALLPDGVGNLLWILFIASTLFIAIYKLPIQWTAKAIIYWLSFNALFTDAVNAQTNTMIAALIIGTFICIRSGREFWAAGFIAIGLFIKLYGIVGLAFFFFTPNKIKFSISFLFWCVLLFLLPMIIASPQFIVQSYADWFNSLMDKNASNIDSVMQNISTIGMLQSIFRSANIPVWAILLPAVVGFGLQYLRIDLYQDIRYQFGLLASVLIFVVLFSTGSESCTYIIAFTGFGIWFILQNKQYSKYVIFLLIFVILMEVMSSSDIAPRFIRKEIIRPYALKSLPFLCTWIILVYQLLTLKKNNYSELSPDYISSEQENP